MTFGQAIEAMKAGQRVARAGWNGSGMWMMHVDSGDFTLPAIGFDQKPKRVPLENFVVMRTVQGHFVPWLASQTDVLAIDWELV